MNDDPRPLGQIQNWLQSVITHPLGVEAGIAADAAQAEIATSAGDVESVILPSRALGSIKRLEVYANAYYARLLECLRDYFPALVHALGEEVFDEFAFGYLQRFPSQSYTLGDLADNFATFLDETRPVPDEAESDAPANWPDFVIDLARLEWNIDSVFDGAGIENAPPLSAERLGEISADDWPQARLVPVVCLRLLSFQFPVNDYYTEFRQGKEPALPLPAETHLALSRRDYVVRRYPLSAAQFCLLKALHQGEPVGAAIAAAAETVDDVDALAGSLRNWFHQWTAAGFFADVRAD